MIDTRRSVQGCVYEVVRVAGGSGHCVKGMYAQRGDRGCTLRDSSSWYSIDRSTRIGSLGRAQSKKDTWGGRIFCDRVWTRDENVGSGGTGINMRFICLDKYIAVRERVIGESGGEEHFEGTEGRMGKGTEEIEKSIGPFVARSTIQRDGKRSSCRTLRALRERRYPNWSATQVRG